MTIYPGQTLYEILRTFGVPSPVDLVERGCVYLNGRKAQFTGQCVWDGSNDIQIRSNNYNANLTFLVGGFNVADVSEEFEVRTAG